VQSKSKVLKGSFFIVCGWEQYLWKSDFSVELRRDELYARCVVGKGVTHLLCIKIQHADMRVLCTVVLEPSVYGIPGQILLSAEQIAKDYVTFHRVLQSYPCFSESRVFGPDIFPVTYIPDGQKMIQA